MGNEMSIRFGSSIGKLKEINSSFDSGVLKVAYHGANRNGSHISKEAFERSMHTIYNCPIVCNYMRDADEIGSHDVDVAVKDGEVSLINVTQPVGVIPESARTWWETFEDDGVEHEYLCVDALIWKRQEAYEKIKNNGVTDESMEIQVMDAHMEDGVYMIESFEFLAFCLLGTAEPCYETASLIMFEADKWKQQYSEMMEDFKKNFQQVNTSNQVDIHPHKNSTEGGKGHLEHKNELLAKYGVEQGSLDFSIEEMSDEELENKLKEMFSSEEAAVNQEEEPASVEETSEEPVITEGDEDSEEGETVHAEEGDESSEEVEHEAEEESEPIDVQAEFELGQNILTTLAEAMAAETVETDIGTMPRYSIYDYDASASEVYCYDYMDWNLYGFKFFMNGDRPVVDFESKKRKKFAIVDFNDGDTGANYKEMFSKIIGTSIESATTKLKAQFANEKASMERRYEEASETIKSMASEIESLKEFKASKLAEKRTTDENAIFSAFSDLDGIDAFETLKGNCSEMTLEEIEDKCYALRGRNATKAFAMQANKSMRLPVEKYHGENEHEEPYGGLFKEFPPKH